MNFFPHLIFKKKVIWEQNRLIHIYNDLIVGMKARSATWSKVSPRATRPPANRNTSIENWQRWEVTVTSSRINSVFHRAAVVT